MKGRPYKNTFAAKGSALYAALEEGREADAKRIYAETSARFHATTFSLPMPVVIYEVDKEGKQGVKYTIESTVAVYDRDGRYVRSKE